MLQGTTSYLGKDLTKTQVHSRAVELTGPTKPSSDVLVKGLSLTGTPDDVTGMVCNRKHNYIQYTYISDHQLAARRPNPAHTWIPKQTSNNNREKLFHFI